jgi:peptidyl-prolyl cis-trans isomerase D
MLQDIRANAQGTVAKIVVGLIVISFSIFGIESILFGSGGNGVAEVNGEDISPQELQQAVNSQKRRLIAMMGENIDPAMLDDDRLTAEAMDTLIGRKLLMQSAEELRLTVSEAQLGRMISEMEQFQINGVFSPELYKSTLSNAGFTPGSFKLALREDLLLAQLRSGIGGSDFATPAELALTARVATEQRDLRYLTIPLQNFIDQAEIGDTEIEQYYNDNTDEFLQPETVVLDYIVLAVDDFREPVQESELLQEYELEIENYAYGNRNRVSHILIEGGDADKIAAVQAALAEGRAFAEVASEYSDDIGSSNNGGDLGYSSGDAFPEEMEEAIAALELNAVSEPVETDAGIHIILLTERETAKAPELEELRMELTDRLQVAEARAQLLLSVENLKDMAFNAEDLDGPAQELGLDVQRAEGITRDQSAGLFANASLIAAAFSDEVLTRGHNSEVIELSDKWVVLRVRQHNEAAPLPLADIRAEVAIAVTEQHAAEQAFEAAEMALAALRSGTSVEQFANDHGYQWQVQLGTNRNSPIVPRSVLQRAFELPAPGDDAGVVEYVTEPTGDVLVFELIKVEAGSLEALPEPAAMQLKQLVAGEYGVRVDSEYRQGLRERADINVM